MMMVCKKGVLLLLFEKGWWFLGSLLHTSCYTLYESFALTIIVTLSPFSKILPTFFLSFFPPRALTSSASSRTRFMYSSNPTIWPSMTSPVAVCSNNHTCTRDFVCRNRKMRLIGCVMMRWTLVAIFYVSLSLCSFFLSLSLSLVYKFYVFKWSCVCVVPLSQASMMMTTTLVSTRSKKREVVFPCRVFSFSPLLSLAQQQRVVVVVSKSSVANIRVCFL